MQLQLCAITYWNKISSSISESSESEVKTDFDTLRALMWVDFTDIPEVQQGKATLVATGADGFYRVRLTSESLNKIEKSHACYVIENLGVEVTTGMLYLGDAVNIPGGDLNTAIDLAISVENGQYSLSIYAINQNDDDSLPDIVICIHPRTERFQSYNEEPHLDWDPDTYLFAKKSN